MPAFTPTYTAGVVVRTLSRRLRVRSTLFFSLGLGADGRSVPLPALESALAFARAARRRGRRVWIERVGAAAYVGQFAGRARVVLGPMAAKERA